MATLFTTEGAQRDVKPGSGSYFSLREMQEAVGGTVEVVYLMDGRLMLVNENGHNKEAGKKLR